MKYYDTKSLEKKTQFVFSSPPWYVSALLLLILGGVYGVAAYGTGAIIPCLLVFGVPALASVVFTQTYARIMGDKYWVKTELLIDIFYIIFALMALLIGRLVNSFYPINMGYLVALSLTIPLWLRHVYISSIILTGQAKSIPISISYTLFIGIWIYFAGEPLISVPTGYFVESAAASLLFSAMFLRALDLPLGNIFGVGGLEFTRWAIEHYKEKSEIGKEKLEDIFGRLGENARIYFSTIGIKKNGRIAGAIVVHTAHPGPVGDAGGSNMPEKLERMTGIEGIFSPHGASIHDLNPVDDKEVGKLASAIKSSLNGDISRVSHPVQTRSGSLNVLAQRIGGYLLVIETSHPHGTEDIDPAIALMLSEKVKHLGYTGLIFVDAHNSLVESTGETDIYSMLYDDIEKAVVSAANRLKDAPLYPAKVGTGQDRSLGIENGVGPMGVQALIIEAGGKKSSYILIDGNNMKPGLRDRIIEETGTSFDAIEVMTSDNHYVNRISGGKNPVGMNGDTDALIRSCKTAVDMAMDDLSPADISVNDGSLIMKVFGPRKSTQLASIPVCVGIMGKYLAFLSLFSLVLTDIVLAMLI